MTTFASRLRKTRIDAGFTQRELARQACIDVSQISRYENGSGEPRPGALKRIAEVLGTSAEWLATGNPDFDPEEMKHEITLHLDDDERARVRVIAERTGRTIEDVVKTLIFEGMALLPLVPGSESNDRRAAPGTKPKGRKRELSKPSA